MREPHHVGGAAWELWLLLLHRHQLPQGHGAGTCSLGQMLPSTRPPMRTCSAQHGHCHLVWLTKAPAAQKASSSSL